MGRLIFTGTGDVVAGVKADSVPFGDLRIGGGVAKCAEERQFQAGRSLGLNRVFDEDPGFAKFVVGFRFVQAGLSIEGSGLRKLGRIAFG
jgi:hypothetical protein